MLDIVENEMKIAILDASAVCHMPDVIEMPYRPNVVDSALADEKAFTYRLAGDASWQEISLETILSIMN